MPGLSTNSNPNNCVWARSVTKLHFESLSGKVVLIKLVGQFLFVFLVAVSCVEAWHDRKSVLRTNHLHPMQQRSQIWCNGWKTFGKHRRDQLPKQIGSGCRSLWWWPFDQISGDSWMYPYQRTAMGNPYISPIYPYSSWVFFGLLSPRIPI